MIPVNDTVAVIENVLKELHLQRSPAVYICTLHLQIYKVIVFVAGEWQHKMVRKNKKEMGAVGGGQVVFFFMYVGGWVGGCLRAVSLLVDLRRGAGPFSQLLVSSLSPLGMTAVAVAALRRPALGGYGERQTSRTVGSEGPRVVCPLLRLIGMSS